jgi:hypothetical protein
MKYFTTTIELRYDKKVTKKSLESLLNELDEEFFIFPFCLFKKTYYSYLKERRNRPYNGFVKENEFEFDKTIFYGLVSNGQTSRQLIMKGQFSEKMGACQVEIDFRLSNFDIIIQTILILGSVIAFIIYKNYLFIAMPIVVILDIVSFTLRNYLKIRNRLKKTLIINNVP